MKPSYMWRQTADRADVHTADVIPCVYTAVMKRVSRICPSWGRKQGFSSKTGNYSATTRTAHLRDRVCREKHHLQSLKKEIPLPEKQSITKVCIDDFAFRKRQTYGTAMVDIDPHRVVDLPASRGVEDVAA